MKNKILKIKLQHEPVGAILITISGKLPIKLIEDLSTWLDIDIRPGTEFSDSCGDGVYHDEDEIIMIESYDDYFLLSVNIEDEFTNTTRIVSRCLSDNDITEYEN